jgi:hypothetical protein
MMVVLLLHLRTTSRNAGSSYSILEPHHIMVVVWLLHLITTSHTCNGGGVVICLGLQQFKINQFYY